MISDYSYLCQHPRHSRALAYAAGVEAAGLEAAGVVGSADSSDAARAILSGLLGRRMRPGEHPEALAIISEWWQRGHDEETAP